MFKTLSLSACLTVAGLLAPSTQVIGQTGPVREGARRTGEAVADGTRAVVRGSREAIGRAGEATRNTVRRTTDATRAQLNRAERSELQTDLGAANNAQADVNAQAGAAGVQANADLNANQQQLNADGQIQGDLNDPNGPDRYESGFRGVEDQNLDADPNMSVQDGILQQAGQVDYNGRVYNVRHDSQGRQCICVGGCPVYLDDQANNAQSREAYKLNDDSMQRSDAEQGDQQYRRDNLQGGTYLPQSGYSSVPAPPVPLRTDVDSAAPAIPSLNADADIKAEQNLDLNDSANVDAAADVDTNADLAADKNDSDSNSAADSDADANNQNEDSSAGESENDSEN